MIKKDKMPTFRTSAIARMEIALNEAASDILKKSRRKAPYQKGGLRSNSDITRSVLSRSVNYWIEYARYQEAGGDGNRTVRNYSTPGTGAHYLEESGKEVLDGIEGIFIKHGRRA